MNVCSNGGQFTQGAVCAPHYCTHAHTAPCVNCMCAVMGDSLHKGQYVHVCSNGVQFTQGAVCACVQ